MNMSVPPDELSRPLMTGQAKATEDQIMDLARTIANQAEALADNRIPAVTRYAQARKILDNADTLTAWLKPEGSTL